MTAGRRPMLGRRSTSRWVLLQVLYDESHHRLEQRRSWIVVSVHEEVEHRVVRLLERQRDRPMVGTRGAQERAARHDRVVANHLTVFVDGIRGQMVPGAL